MGSVHHDAAMSDPTCASTPLDAALLEPVSLAGRWRLALDRDDRGLAERWFARELIEEITLPGSLPQQGVGDPVTVETRWVGTIFDPAFYQSPQYARYRDPENLKFPFWLQPDHYFAGVAWYQRVIDVPEAWRGQRVGLTLERPHWATRVWIDDREVGANDSLSTPHRYELGFNLSAGRHQLTVRVDNRRVVDIGENSHSITDHTQGNWNGIVGRIELAVSPPVWIEEVQVYPELAARHVIVRGRLGRVEGFEFPAAVEVAVRGPLVAGGEAGESTIGGPVVAAGPLTVPVRDGRFDATYPIGNDLQTWDEFHPARYRLEARLANGACHAVTFGVRQFAADGAQLMINGRKAFIRGTLECASFPCTGHPPMDVAEWKRLLTIMRDHGLNAVRFHSWCPPEAAFVAGDELGFYFQVEAGSWPNHSTTLGDGHAVDAWLEAETLRILQAYGNHPSFVMMASSNEPGGEAGRDRYLTDWVARHRAADPRRLFTSGAGWPELPENPFHVTPEPRIQHWEEGLKSRINARPPETCSDYRSFVGARAVPVISHEIGQWCAFPDFDEVTQYTGYLKPRNLEIFAEIAAAQGLRQRAREFLHASGRLQLLCYKEEIESALRTQGMGGFQLLSLSDFPGQGTAPVGVLNTFWQSKSYASAAEFRRFCGATVPLARLPRRVYTEDETLTVEWEVAHFGRAELDVLPYWQLTDAEGHRLSGALLPAGVVPVGSGTGLGRLELPLRDLPAPAQYRLMLGFAGTAIENDWDVWVYPVQKDTTPVAAGVGGAPLVARSLDSVAWDALAAGRAVLLMLPSEQIRNDGPDPVHLGFSSIFWNTSCTRRQAPTTLGIMCDPQHPALAQFPTEAHSNWQWWYVISRAAALRLDHCPRELEPIVRVIDDWFTSRSLGLVVEARVGPGRLLVVSADLLGADDPVNRQLLTSLTHYAASERFDPTVTLSRDQVQQWITPL
jgi:hypothetical protein